MARAKHQVGDVELNELFDAFDAQVVSPGGAAQLLGVSRQTVYTLCKRGDLRLFKGAEVRRLKGLVSEGPSWGYIPLQDVALYAQRVERMTPMLEKQLPPGGERTGPDAPRA